MWQHSFGRKSSDRNHPSGFSGVSNRFFGCGGGEAQVCCPSVPSVPSVPGLQLSLGDPGWSWQQPGCRHAYTSINKKKKKKRIFPCILNFPCKVNPNQMGENFFFLNFFLVTPPGQPNIIYAPYGEHWREG